MIYLIRNFRILLLIACIVILPEVKVGIAIDDLLEGMVFVGQYGEKHKGGIDKDEVRFLNGKFRSASYEQKGFNEGVYIARIEEGKIHFEAEAVSPKLGKIRWTGVVKGNSIEANYRWRKKGWLSDTVKEYIFKGILKK